jgi:hypothetical protein
VKGLRRWVGLRRLLCARYSSAIGVMDEVRWLCGWWTGWRTAHGNALRSCALDTAATGAHMATAQSIGRARARDRCVLGLR